MRKLLPIASLALLVAACGGSSSGEESLGAGQALGGNSHAEVCPGPSNPGSARCHAHVLVDAQGQPAATTLPSGLGPSDLRSAYSLAGTSGGGRTVAIVDALGYPNAEADLAVYRSTYGLTPCTTANGCFKKVDQNGGTSYPRADTGWSQEQALDIDMVSAICPDCKILLVQAASAQFKDLSTAVNTAARLGASVISNSYGGGEGSSAPDESAFNHPGVAITVSSGDNGYGVQFPASSQYVTAVGGTHLVKDSSARGWTETAWSGAGSGCSAFIAKPTWQTDALCNKRMVADVSAVADPNTGVAVYAPVHHNSGWLVFGGTSVAAPVVGSIYALNVAGTSASYAYSHASALHDVTSGSNGTCGGTYQCTAGAGYDGPTGLGTPNGATAF